MVSTEGDIEGGLPPEVLEQTPPAAQAGLLESAAASAPDAATTQPFLETKDACFYLGVEVPKANGGSLVPLKENFREYFYTKDDYLLMREIATSLVMNHPLLVEGGTGIGKTSAVKRMCADLNLNYCLVSFSENTDLMDVIGHKDITLENGQETFKWYDGKLIEAIRHGGVAFLDEYNFQGGKIGARINPIIDAILNNDKRIILPENDNEIIDVHPNFRLIAAQNPPGTEEGEEFTGRDVLSAERFGRWTFQKLPLRMSEQTRENRLLGMMGKKIDVSVPQEEYRTLGSGLPLNELIQIPGMEHWAKKIVEITELLNEKVRDRSLGRQAQKIYINPRLEQKMLRYVSRFYRGDINETWQNALNYYVTKMFKSEADRAMIDAIIQQSFYEAAVDSDRLDVPDTPPAPAAPAKTPEAGKSLAERRFEAELAPLEASDKVPDSIKAALRGAETPLPVELEKQIEEAKKILGRDVLGPEEIKAAFKLTKLTEVPAIPFSKDALERAKELGQMLVLRQPVTMKEMLDSLEGKLKDGTPIINGVGAGGKVISDSWWFKDQKFFTEERPLARWALVSKEFIPDSTNKNYLQQTDQLIVYLGEVFKHKVLPREYDEAIKEYQAARGGIEAILTSDWEKAAEQLEALKITKLTRHLPAELMWDTVAYFQTNNRRLHEGAYAWTGRRGSDGGLGDFGSFDAEGAYVNGWDPNVSYPSVDRRGFLWQSLRWLNLCPLDFESLKEFRRRRVAAKWRIERYERIWSNSRNRSTRSRYSSRDRAVAFAGVDRCRL